VTIPPRGGSLPHSLNSTNEVIYIISGSATAEVNGEPFRITEGDTLYIPPDSVQTVTNTGTETLEYLTLLDPYWRRNIDVSR
jgi:mannose-6-phosphate isomerase-like protein (cupin superfamily)